MRHLKLILSSLLKNDACIEGGRRYKWWVALIFLLLSAIISIVPITVTTLSNDAGTYITGGALETDKGIIETVKVLEKNGFDLKFHNTNTEKDTFDTKQNPYFTVEHNGQPWTEDQNNGFFPITIKEKRTIVETSTVNGTTSTTYIEDTTKIPNDPNNPDAGYKEVPVEKEIFKLYVFPSLKGEDLSKVIYTIRSGEGFDPYTGVVDKNPSTDYNKTSYIIFGKEAFAFYKYSASGTIVNQGYQGTYHHIKNASFVNAINGTQEAPTFEDKVQNTATFLREGYEKIKLDNAGIQIAIYSAINTGLMLLMGVVLFIMTRGKNNPYRCYKIMECFKIAAWTGFTPAVLALIMGFMFSTNGMGGFMFVLMYGLRSMWLAMKNLRPAPQA